MLRSASADLVDAWWCAALGVPSDALRRGVAIVEHAAAFREYRGIYAFRAGGGCVVSAPATHVEAIRRALAGLAPEAAFDARAIVDALGPDAGLVVGPAWLGYADAPVPDPGTARRATAGDRAALARLLEACSQTEREHSGVAPGHAPLFAVFEGGEALAAASSRERGPDIRHLGVIAHPAHRGRGHARAAAAALTNDGVARGVVMQWQTLYANTPSLAIGRALGYEHRYDTIAVRLR